jgi:heme-degrading monooxygenase HmoA
MRLASHRVSAVEIDAITVPRRARWRSEEDFRAWMQSAGFGAGHAQQRADGPVGTASELWSFDVLEREEA